MPFIKAIKSITDDENYTLRQLAVLEYLYRHQNATTLSTDQLSTSLSILKPSVTRITKKLLATQLISCATSDEDMRKRNFKITAKGKRVYEDMTYSDEEQEPWQTHEFSEK